MEKHLFYVDPFLMTLDTTVRSVTQKEGKYHVVLTDTIFYPEGGGQPSDQGTINGKQVLHVYEQEDIIYHVMEEAPPLGAATCQLNSYLRIDHMQHHSGQHLLSAVLHNDYGYETRGFHLGEEYTTIDITAPQLKQGEVQEIETKVNASICEDLVIDTYIVTPNELKELPVRKLPEVTSNIRIVEISKIDYSPCCGTHLLRTGQIGLLKIIKTEKYKQMTRLYFVCGQRALRDYRNKHAVVSALCTLLSSSEAALIERVELQVDTLKKLETINKGMRQELMKYRAQEIINSAKGALIELDLGNEAFEDVQYLAKSILSLGDFIVLFSVETRVLLGQSGVFDIDCGKLIKESAPEFEGRGGGNKQSAQAFFPSEHQMTACKQLLRNQVLSTATERDE